MKVARVPTAVRGRFSIAPERLSCVHIFFTDVQVTYNMYYVSTKLNYDLFDVRDFDNNCLDWMQTNPIRTDEFMNKRIEEFECNPNIITKKQIAVLTTQC